MMWIIRLVVCLVAVSSYSNLCDGTRLEEFLQEKQEYLREFDSLFDTFLKTTSSQRVGSPNTNAQRQALRSQPLPSPDWSTHAVSFDDVAEEDTDDYLNSSLSEDENYRPREEGSGIEVRVGDSVENSPEDVFSGDSVLFLTGKAGDDDEGYEDVGSGDSRTKTTPSRQTTSIMKETTTSAPVEAEADNVVSLECKDHLRAEMKLCIVFSFNVKTMFQEMENFVDQSGYYNGSSSYYFLQLFRTCASTIVSPPSCLERDADKNVMGVVNNIVTAISYRNDDGAGTEHGHLDCFHTHLQFLQFCLLSATLTNEQLETLVRMIIVRAKDASVQECQDLQDVQQCVVVSMTKCEDSTSVRLADEMFEATKRVITCAVNTTKSGSGAAVMSLGSVVTLAFSVLALGFHKQVNN